MLEIFNINNINFASIINSINDKKEIDFKNLMINIESLVKEQGEISEYLKCNSSDGNKYTKIDEKLIDIQHYLNKLALLIKNVENDLKSNVIDFMNSYDIDKLYINSLYNDLNIKKPLSNYKSKFNFIKR